MNRGFLLIILLLIIPSWHLDAKVRLSDYGIYFPQDSIENERHVAIVLDSLLFLKDPQYREIIMSDIQKERPQHIRTSDFYLLLLLCIILGIIRYIDPQYFTNLWRSFWNPILSNRQLKDQLQREKLSNFLMNTFFIFVEGAYLYYVLKMFTPAYSSNVLPSLLIIMLIGITGIIYFAKYLSIRFCGWAFRVEGITDNYLFNVFLINKVLAISLIPFIIILAFADKSFAMPAVLLSFVFVIALILNRYFRSWQSLGSFFQFSKFHFFMYLCTSEILPLAVIIKFFIKKVMF